jgi:hypothetical protein
MRRRPPTAALPVAVGLLAFAALARAVLWTGFADAQAQRTARRHLEPLSLWCIGALAVYVFARSAAGDSWLGAFAVAAALGAVALALWRGGNQQRAAAENGGARVADAPAPPPAEPPAPARSERSVPPPPAADRPLWADAASDGAAQRGLWSRG